MSEAPDNHALPERDRQQATALYALIAPQPKALKGSGGGGSCAPVPAPGGLCRRSCHALFTERAGALDGLPNTATSAVRSSDTQGHEQVAPTVAEAARP